MPTIFDLLNYDKPFSFGKSMIKKVIGLFGIFRINIFLITKNGIIENKLENYTSYSDWKLKKQNKINQQDVELLKAIKQTFNNRMINNKLLYED